MTDEEDNITLGKFVFDNNNQERKSWACLGQTCSRPSIVFLSQPFVILLIIFGCFCRIHFLKTCDESVFGLEFCAVRQDKFYPAKIMNKSPSTKNRVSISLVGPSKTGK